MYDEERLLGIHADLRQMKEHRWKEHGERDMPPLIAFHFGDQGASLPEREITKALSDGFTLGQIIETAFKMMEPELLQLLDSVWIGTDGHGRISKEPLPTEYERGDLRDDFETNPASDVTEILITLTATDDLCGGCDIQHVIQPYTVTDGGVIQWGEPITAGADGGQVSSVLKEHFRKEKL